MRWDPLQRLWLVYQGGGDPPAQTSTTNVTQMYSPAEAARRAQLMAEAERIYGRTKGIAGGMEGPSPSADTLRAQQMLREFAGGADFSNMLGTLGQAQQFGLNAAMNPTATPGFQDVLNTTTRQLNEAYMGPEGPFARIRSQVQAGNTSGGSGSREGIAMGMAGRDYLNTVGDVTGKLTMDAYRMGTDTMLKSMAMAPQTAQMMTMPANIIGGIGQQTESYDEASRMWDLNAPWMALQPYANAVMGMSNPSTQTTSTVPGPRANPMAPIGGAMMGGSLAAMMGFNPVIGAGAGLMLSLFD